MLAFLGHQVDTAEGGQARLAVQVGAGDLQVGSATVAVTDAVGIGVPTVPDEGPATLRVGLALPTVKEPLAGEEDNPLADPMRV